MIIKLKSDNFKGKANKNTKHEWIKLSTKNLNTEKQCSYNIWLNSLFLGNYKKLYVISYNSIKPNEMQTIKEKNFSAQGEWTKKNVVKIAFSFF